MSDAFLAIPGIRGGATARGHFGEIEVLSYNATWSRPGEMTVIKPVDGASSALFAAAFNGRTFGSVVLTQSWGENGGYLLTLNFVNLTSYSSSHGTEQFTLNFDSFWGQSY